ncbi:hypothetical protein A3D23_03585 [candidate division WOR-1 bacterium RIFCSPHIGHO2_02_FULL_53_26]|nr:MAG: hypothetical protein A3D23_03585 [candidate division WOR-1 bacterium RIFCSPHIGHO2_02_FULL_53_26]
MATVKDIQVKSLVEITSALSSSLNLESTLEAILNVLSDSLEMQRGTITLVDPNTNELRIEVAQGLSRQEKERGRYMIGEGITGRVVETGEPMIVEDIGAEPLFLNRTQARKNLAERKFAFLCVPVIVGSKVIGALSVDRLFKGSVSYEEDIKLLMIIASMVGQAVRIRELAEKDKQAVVFENIKLRQELKGKYQFDNIVYSSRVMESVLEGAIQVAASQAAVMLRGESGTGKELIASAIHYASPRADKPFIKVACAALPENLLESELFGYERGAFTGAMERKIGRFELAGQGTIFLDEIGDLTPATQVKLLRVLQEKEFERLGGTQTIKMNARVVCATHRDLEEMVKSGKFREDLFYRINVFPVLIPPLRERKEDILVLVDHFINKFKKENKKKVRGVSRAALDVLMAYRWPGNVRELENVIERAIILCQKELITPAELPANIAAKETIELPAAGATLPEIIETIEKQNIREALEKYKTQRNAAKALGLTERMLGYKIKKYKIIACLIGFLLSSVSASFASLDDISLGYVSRYVWRGFELNSMQPAIQPGLTFSLGREEVTLQFWGSYNIGNVTKRELTELDAYLNYSSTYQDWLDWYFSYAYYTFPNLTGAAGKSGEIFLGLTQTQAPFAPTLTISYDHDQGKGLYVQLGGKQEIGPVTAGLTVGYNGGQWGAQPGVSDGSLSLSSKLNFGSGVLVPSLNYAVFTPDIAALNVATGGNADTGSFWFGVTYSNTQTPGDYK